MVSLPFLVWVHFFPKNSFFSYGRLFWILVHLPEDQSSTTNYVMPESITIHDMLCEADIAMTNLITEALLGAAWSRWAQEFPKLGLQDKICYRSVENFCPRVSSFKRFWGMHLHRGSLACLSWPTLPWLHSSTHTFYAVIVCYPMENLLKILKMGELNIFRICLNASSEVC